MTRDDVLDVLSVVAMKWPHANLGNLDEAVTIWLAELAVFERADVEAAVLRLGDREFPPTCGHVAAEVRRALQGPPPGFDDMLAAVWAALPQRVFLRRFYRPEGAFGRAATAEAVAVMQANGAHEAACRFVQSRGIRAVWLIPDGSMYPLDLNQQADRRDSARYYVASVLPDFERDPSQGLALDRACRTASLDAGEVRELAAGIVEQHQLAIAARPELPAPADTEDEAMVDFDLGQVLDSMRAERERRQTARIQARHDQLQAEREHRAAAERELAEHAARRGAAV